MQRVWKGFIVTKSRKEKKGGGVFHYKLTEILDLKIKVSIFQLLALKKEKSLDARNRGIRKPEEEHMS